MIKVIVGTDRLGAELKDSVRRHLLAQGVAVQDVTPDNEFDYFRVGYEGGSRVASGEFDRGFIFGSTGMGESIMANRFAGVYCALCESLKATELARELNNANVLALGSRLVAPDLANQMVDAFMMTPFNQSTARELEPNLQANFEHAQLTGQQIVREQQRAAGQDK